MSVSSEPARTEWGPGQARNLVTTFSTSKLKPLTIPTDRSARFAAMQAELILVAMLIIAACLAGLSLTGQLLDIAGETGEHRALVDLFDVSREANIPTWYSSMALAACAVLAVRCAEPKNRRERRSWFTLSVVLAMASLDEMARFHERVGGTIREFVVLSGPFHFIWVIPGMLTVACVIAFFARFWLSRAPDVRRAMLLATVLFVGGAIGLEMAGGWYVSLNSSSDFTYTILVTIEEFCEMAGVAVGAYALLLQLRSDARSGCEKAG